MGQREASSISKAIWFPEPGSPQGCRRLRQRPVGPREMHGSGDPLLASMTSQPALLLGAEGPHSARLLIQTQLWAQAQVKTSWDLAGWGFLTRPVREEGP